jgi:hypothetical protein
MARRKPFFLELGTSARFSGITLPRARQRCPTDGLRAALDGGRGVLDRTFLPKAVRMRSVRCDVCGAKALIAASQCPKCSHLFETRDGFGELLPLAYCSSCESHYPAHVGSCKWCGTVPEPEPTSPLIWKRAAVGGLVAIAFLGGFLMLREPRRKPASHARATAQAKPRPAASDTSDPVLQTLPADTFTVADTSAAAGASVVPVVETADVPTATAPEPVVPQGMPHAGLRMAAPRNGVTRVVAAPSPSRVVTTDPIDNSNPAPSSAPSSASSRSRAQASRWVVLIAKNWITVRMDARDDAHVVASVGPESRVQLGELRGSWRRLRSRDISGWVDLRRASFGEVRGSTRANGLASR